VRKGGKEKETKRKRKEKNEAENQIFHPKVKDLMTCGL
jgi:hypothetical protein